MTVFISIMTIIIIVSLGDFGGTPLQDAGRRRDIVEAWGTAAAPNRTQTSGHPELTSLGTFRHRSVDIGEQTWDGTCGHSRKWMREWPPEKPGEAAQRVSGGLLQT